MLTRMAVLVFTGLAVLAGCANTGGVTTASKVIESSHVDPGTGNLIAWWMKRCEGTPKGELSPVLVTHPYAIFIQWPNEEYFHGSANKRVFVFYDNAAKKTYQTRDFDAFLEVVAKQPPDITLLQFDTCTVNRAHLPKEHWDRLEKALASGNRKWAVNPVEGRRTLSVCYCAFDWDFVLPGDKH